MAEEVWGDCDGESIKQRRFGKGRVFWGMALKDILSADGVTPDFQHTGDGKTYIDFIHRTTRDAEIYFVANRNNRKEQTGCRFRVSGKEAQLWDPLWGEKRKLSSFSQDGSRMTLPLTFLPHQAFFVVFKQARRQRKAAKPGKENGNDMRFIPVQPITGPRKVRFDTAWGGPKEVEFAQLEDWTKRPENGIRYFSGTAVYTRYFDLTTPLEAGGRLFLNLGVVKNMAEVRLNDRPLGIVWTAPWQVDITEAVKQKDNKLEIEVVNLWPNRLIGDAALPASQRLTHTNIPFKEDMPLLPSGLLGPASLVKKV